jgi:hypothetical protein
MIQLHSNTLVDRVVDGERADRLRSDFDPPTSITIDQDLF